MNKQRIMKWALPALLMSALFFELMPGSVQYYAKDVAVIPEGTWNFFAVPVEGTAASCLPIAGIATLVAVILAVVALCFKKNSGHWDDTYTKVNPYTENTDLIDGLATASTQTAGDGSVLAAHVGTGDNADTLYIDYIKPTVSASAKAVCKPVVTP